MPRPRLLEPTNMHQDCDECTRLWNEYALASRHYLNLERRLKLAALSREKKTVKELSPLVERAAEERNDLRREIEAHDGEGRAAASAQNSSFTAN